MLKQFIGKVCLSSSSIDPVDWTYQNSYFKEDGFMSRRRRSVMSDELKNELAKDLGFYDTVQQEGWGGIKAKDAGNMVKRAIQLAEQAARKS